MAKITDIEELERLMKGRNAALKSVEPIRGDETFTFITSRYSPNLKVEPSVGKAFVKKYEGTEQLKEIGLNVASTTLYVLR